MTEPELAEPFPGVEVPAAWWDRVGGELAYNAEKADKAVRFFPRFCRHWEGELGGKPFTLAAWQERRLIRPAFGLIRADGLRAIRRIFCEIPRKNGKSLLASGVANLLTFADGEPGARVVSAALDKGQASLVYDSAASSVEASPALSARARIFRGNSKRIVVPHTGSSYSVVSSDGRRSHGGNLHGMICDELHTWPGLYQGSLLEALLTSTGSRRQPLAFIITTAGYDRDSICFHEYSRARNVRDGILARPDYLPVIFEADLDRDNWQDRDVWARVNPGLGISKKLDYMETQFAEALETPTARNTFLRLDLNVWTDQARAWIPTERWAALGDPELEFPHGAACCAGLDLSTSEDTTAFVLAWIRPDGHVGLWPHVFIPEATVKAREGSELVPYREWAELGFCSITPGSVIDYEAVLAYVRECRARCVIERIGFDPWNCEFFRQRLDALGFETVEFRQTYAHMGEPTAMFQRLWKGDGRKLVHDGNPCFAYQARCSAVTENHTGQITPDKAKSHGRIDAIVGSIMATWLRVGGELPVSADQIVA